MWALLVFLWSECVKQVGQNMIGKLLAMAAGKSTLIFVTAWILILCDEILLTKANHVTLCHFSTPPARVSLQVHHSWRLQLSRGYSELNYWSPYLLRHQERGCLVYCGLYQIVNLRCLPARLSLIKQDEHWCLSRHYDRSKYVYHGLWDCLRWCKLIFFKRERLPGGRVQLPGNDIRLNCSRRPRLIESLELLMLREDTNHPSEDGRWSHSSRWVSLGDSFDLYNRLYDEQQASRRRRSNPQSSLESLQTLNTTLSKAWRVDSHLPL